MGLSVMFRGASDGGDGPFDLATATGWSLFAQWAESLPAGEFDAVRQLAETGEVWGTDALGEQLAVALESHPPGSPDVTHTARSLLENVGVGDPGETAAVTDGESPGDGDSGRDDTPPADNGDGRLSAFAESPAGGGHFDPDKHPHKPPGPGGGQFAPKGGDTPAGKPHAGGPEDGEGPGYDTGGPGEAERVAKAVSSTPAYRALYGGAHALALAAQRRGDVRPVALKTRAELEAALGAAALAAAPEVAAVTGKSEESVRVRLGQVARRMAHGLTGSDFVRDFVGYSTLNGAIAEYRAAGGTPEGLRGRPDLLGVSPGGLLNEYDNAAGALLERPVVRRILDRHFLGVERPDGHVLAFNEPLPPPGRQGWWHDIHRPVYAPRAPGGGAGRPSP